ncbi:macro domain-containing protein [Schleiferilactobacillus perolens]|nr:macro domain-containing protein [Schleiferilactobacillus perolens]
MNTVNVGFFDKTLRRSFVKVLSGISLILSLTLVFIDIPKKVRFDLGMIFLAGLGILYIAMLIRANLQRSIVLKFGNTTVEVSLGDLFKQNDLKVVSFNEYFDDVVDDKIIAKNSINGKYLSSLSSSQLEDVRDKLQNAPRLAEKGVQVGTNFYRKEGKKKQYRLGTIVVLPDDYLATAASKFTSDNKAVVTMSEYISFLMNFWDEVDRVYNGRSVSIPVFGSGMLRFRGGYDNVSDQDLLQIILWTFKVSKIKFTYPARLHVVVYKQKSAKYNLYKLKELENNGLSQ